MNVSLCFIFYNFLIIILTFFSEVQSTTGQTGPGISSCFYLANIDTACNIPKIVELKDVPKSCTSFLAIELAVKADFNVYTPIYDNYNYGFLQTLGKSVKNFYLYYRHEDFTQFLNTLNGGEEIAMKEINNLIAVQKEIPGITGLLITDFKLLSDKLNGLTDQVVKYIQLIKEKACLEVGLMLGRKMIDYCDNHTYSWMDFTTLNSHVNFYVITIEKFHDTCTADLRDTGLAPMNGKTSYTLEKLECGIKNSKILNEKLYFMFDLSPTKTNEKEIETICGGTYQELCSSPDSTKDWCSDTIESFYDKGCWVKRNGVGFIGRYVDIDDPQNTCKCGAFPSFHAILAGVKGCAKPPACRLLDRQP